MSEMSDKTYNLGTFSRLCEVNQDSTLSFLG